MLPPGKEKGFLPHSKGLDLASLGNFGLKNLGQGQQKRRKRQCKKKSKYDCDIF